MAMQPRKEWESENPGGDYDQYKADYNDQQQSSAYDQLMGVAPTEGVDYNAMYDAMASMYEKLSTMNEDKFNRYWPQSIQQGISAAQQFDTAGQAQAANASAFNMSLADNMNNWLANLTKYGNIFMRDEAGKSNQWIMGQVKDVNKFNSEEFYTALDNAMPGVRDTAASYKKTVDQMLSGQLPEDVKAQIAQTAAERGLSGGVYGPAYNAASVRDLGLNSLQMMQAGQGQMGQLMSVTGALTAPIASPNIYQNVMMTPTPYTAQPSYVQPSNVAGISGNYLSAIMGSTMMQPQAGVQSAIQMGGIQNQTNLANTQLQYAKAMGGLNYSMDQQAMAQQYEMFKQQMNAAQEQNWWNLGGSLLGAGATLGGAGIMSGATK